MMTTPRNGDDLPRQHISTPWLTVEEACAYSKRSDRTIWDACRSGKLRASQQTPGGRWMIHRDDLDAYLFKIKPRPLPARAKR